MPSATDELRTNDLPGRVLVVDDDPGILRLVGRILRSAHYEVVPATTFSDAMAAFQTWHLDAVVSDIGLPDGDGLALAKALRETDANLPVVLITGHPDLETAIAAVGSGATRFIVKPFKNEDLLEAVHEAHLLHRLNETKQEAFEILRKAPVPLDRAELQAVFSRTVGGLQVLYQPIVEARTGQPVGYEALMRSNERQLPDPGSVLSAAERLGRVVQLGRTVRRRTAADLEAHPGVTVFVNLHPEELLDDQLYDPHSPLARFATSVILEVTERERIELIDDLPSRVTALRRLGYRLAVDDMGAGYAGLSSFARLQPEFAKIDMSLVRDIDRRPVLQRVVGTMTSLCRELGVTVVAEGVETRAEAHALLEIGCDLLQGFHFADPGPPFPPTLPLRAKVAPDDA